MEGSDENLRLRSIVGPSLGSILCQHTSFQCFHWGSLRSYLLFLYHPIWPTNQPEKVSVEEYLAEFHCHCGHIVHFQHRCKIPVRNCLGIIMPKGYHHLPPGKHHFVYAKYHFRKETSFANQASFLAKQCYTRRDTIICRQANIILRTQNIISAGNIICEAMLIRFSQK